MAESQLMCMEDGHIGVKVPESKPEFYYSEEQRAAIEELLKNGDGAFKMRLKDDNMKDFLSAREVKACVNTFKEYGSGGDESGGSKASETDADSGVHSTYWPEMSDTEVPQLDNGWPGTSMFRGVTRVAVHTHPPKENGPHIKEVVRRLIQESSKVIAIVMDILTDVHILQDLMDAAWRRSVPVYILLDHQGVPHFLDMCSRLQIGSQHLRKIRARSLQGVGFSLSFGRLPGSLCSRYMLVDGDKVMFGSYSFSWCTSRMDRNMITVMTGQVVDFFDRDFRELYAISSKMDLYKEFHVTPPAATKTATLRSKEGPKRPPIPAATSRFQVTLGESRKADIQVPAHKYYNPKYALVFGDNPPRPPGSLQEPGPKRKPTLAEVLEEMDPDEPRVARSDKTERLSPLPAQDSREIFKTPNGINPDKKGRRTLRVNWNKLSTKDPVTNLENNKSPPTPDSKRSPPPRPPAPVTNRRPTSKETTRTEESDESFEIIVRTPSKWSKKNSKLGRRTVSEQTVDTGKDSESIKSRPRGKGCKIS
ncbi:protein FAM83F-like [Cheilinus undulatus]|uniref:protein FAM83F-like n=1 Tax=Cheilinus undulatus TaxID=241271 RepID=UPI001BD40053|nr:protein FAM83F-like [Cheilinus undulatus]